MNTYPIFIEMFMNIFESFSRPNLITNFTVPGERAVIMQTTFFDIFSCLERVLDPWCDTTHLWWSLRTFVLLFQIAARHLNSVFCKTNKYRRSEHVWDKLLWDILLRVQDLSQLILDSVSFCAIRSLTSWLPWPSWRKNIKTHSGILLGCNKLLYKCLIFIQDGFSPRISFCY